MTAGDRHTHWDWFVAAIGLILLGLCSLNPSVVAFGIGLALLTAGLLASLLRPHVASRARLPGAPAEAEAAPPVTGMVTPTERDSAANT